MSEKPAVPNDQSVDVGKTTPYSAPTADALPTVPDPGRPLPAIPPGLPSVPGYEVLEELGRGGMGVVYRAVQVKAQRPVALKMIRGGALASDEELARFRLEVELVARLRHPNIVQVYEVGEADSGPFFSMELCEGGSLAALVLQHFLSPGEAASLTETLARAIEHAHQAGVVHRDLKPANVLLQEEVLAKSQRAQREKEEKETSDSLGPSTLDSSPLASLRSLRLCENLLPKITDFGLAKRLDEELGQTRTGAVLGTPAYMAPEQAQGATRYVGPAADVYALGVILYQCLTGRPPFLSLSAAELLDKVRSEEPAPPRRFRADIPGDLETICLKCLRKEPHERYASAAALADDLRRFQAGEPIAARPPGRVERLVKWARRKPTLAAVYALSLLTVLLGGFTVGAVGLWRNAENAGQEAKEQRDRAEAAKRELESLYGQLKAAKQQIEQQRYLYLVRLAQKEAHAREFDRAMTFLQSCEPQWRDWEWHHVHRLCRRPVRVLTSHASYVITAAVSPEGTHAVSLGWQDGMKETALATGKVERTFAAPNTMAYFGAAYSPDGRWLAVSYAEDKAGKLTGHLRLWDRKAGTDKVVFSQEGECVNDLVFSPDSKLLAGGCRSHCARLWNTTSWKVERSCQATREPLGLAFSPDGRLLAAAEDGKVAHVWTVADGGVRQELDFPVTTIGVAFGRERLAVFQSNGVVRLFDLADYKVRGETQASPEGKQGCRNVAFLPDGTTLVIGRGEQLVRHDLTNGREKTFEGHQGLVSALALTPDGRHIVTGGTDGTVRVWDVNAPPVHHDPYVRVINDLVCHAATFSPDGQRVGYLQSTALGAPPKARVCDRNGLVQREIQLERQPHHLTPCFSPDLRYLAFVRKQQAGEAVVLLDLETNAERTFDATRAGGRVMFLFFSPDGKRLAGCTDSKAILWKVDDATVEHVIPDVRLRRGDIVFPPDNLCLSPDGRTIAYQQADAVVVREIDGQTRFLLKGHSGQVYGLAFSDRGDRLVTCGNDRTVRVWDTTTGKELALLIGHSAPVSSVAFHPNGRRVVSAGLDNTIRVWDLHTGQEAWLLERPAVGFQSVQFGDGGRRLAWVRDGGVLEYTEAPLGPDDVLKPPPKRPPFFAGQLSVRGVGFSPDGKRLLTADQLGGVNVWDAANGDLRQRHDAARGAVPRLPVFLRDGTGFLRQQVDRLELIDTGTGKARATWQRPATLYVADARADGSAIAVVDTRAGLLRLWEPLAARERFSVKATEGNVTLTSVAFRPDGLTVAVLNSNGQPVIWDAVTGQRVRECDRAVGISRMPVFSADGKKLAAAGVAGRIHIWHADGPAAGKTLAALNHHTRDVVGLALSPDGEFCVSASADGAVKVWEAATGKVTELTGLERGATSVTFSPDGKQVVAGGADGLVKMWPWPPADK